MTAPRACVTCSAPLTLTGRKTHAPGALACASCRQEYVPVESRPLFGATVLVVVLAGAREWIAALVSLGVVFLVATFGTTYYAVDADRRVRARWHRGARGA